MPIKLLIFTLLCSCTCFSQGYQLSGRLESAKNSPIEFANIILSDSENPNQVHGSVSKTDGGFVIKEIAEGSYILEISFIGYSSYTSELDITGDINLETIVLQEDTEELEAVNLEVKQPTFKKQSDRIVFNIEETSLTEGNMMDVLRSTPGILIINDEISVKNSSDVIYLINNKRVYLTGDDLQQLLSGTSANDVKAVEVITNPPAKYDAEGSAVINIVMSKNLITGYNGSVFANYTQGKYPRYAAGMSHFYKTDKLNIFANYAYTENKVNRYNLGEVKFIENNEQIGLWNNTIDRNTKNKTHNANINIDYDINDANTLSFSANGSITPYWKRQTKTATEAVDSSFVSYNDTDDNTTNLAFNVDYVNRAESGNTFSVNLHHTSYDYDRDQDIASDYYSIDNMFTHDDLLNTAALQNTYIYSAQADYSMPLDFATVEFGAKASFIDSESDVTQVMNTTGTPVLDTENSGVFDYLERNYAVYGTFSKSWDMWQLTAGIRGEFTDVDSEVSNTLTKDKNDFDYFKVFPTVNISHDFNENHSLGLSYGKRISRPTYSSLNPFKYYFNNFTFLQGNPNLQPSITQLLTLSYTLKQTYTFEVYYRYQKDPAAELVFQENRNNKLIYGPVNLDESIDFGFDFISYKPITNVWSIYFINSIFHEKAYFEARQSGGTIESNETWAMYSNFMNFFTFLEDRSLNLDVSLLYLSPMINGSADISSRTQVDLGVKKSFNNGKWVASLKANDIFRTTDFTVKNKYLNQDNTYYTRFDNQWIRVGLRYNFGNTRLTTNEREAQNPSERNRLNSEGEGK